MVAGSEFDKVCSNCDTFETCKAARSMKEYPHPVPCVFYQGYERSENTYEEMKNVNPNIDPSMFVLKGKESFEYPVCDRHKMPTVNGIDIDGIYLNDGVDGLSFSPVNSSYYPLVRQIMGNVQNGNYNFKKEIYKFFGEHFFHGRRCIVNSISFRLNTSGSSGPDWAIDLGTYSSSGICVSLYPYKKEISNIEYWNKLINFFQLKELVDGKLMYNVINHFERPKLELKVLKTIRKFQL